MTQYRVNTYTNNSTSVVWYVVEFSDDGGQTWTPVISNSPTFKPTNGVVAGQILANVTAVMNQYHSAAVGNFNDASNWTIGPVAAGPV